MNTSSLAIPLLLIIVGATWFLRATDILPATSTLVAGGLFVAGVAVLIMDGINKQSVISGPMLMYIGAAIYIYTQYWLSSSPLFALGMMLLGCLLLLSRSNIVPYKQDKRLLD